MLQAVINAFKIADLRRKISSRWGYWSCSG